jgi:hypothetical protein
MMTLKRHWHPAIAAALCLSGILAEGCTTSTSGTTSGGSGSTTGTGSTSGSGGATTGGTTGATTGGTSSGGNPGNGTITTATLQVQGVPTTFTSPFDAALNSDGSTIYFTGIGPTGSGVFSTPAGAGGGAVSTVAVGFPLEAPFGIAVSTNDHTLYVADPSTVASQKGLGAILSVAATSGTPISVTGSEDTSPLSLAVLPEGGVDQIYFTGLDVTDGSQAILKIPAAGGTPIVLAKGAPFVSLAGIAVAGSVVYVLDNSSGGTTVYALDTHIGTPGVLVGGLQTNFPGGIAVVQDGSALLVAAIDPATEKDSFARIVLATKAVSYLTPAGVAGFTESGGLHRGANTDTYAWVDGTANSGGIVSLLK